MSIPENYTDDDLGGNATFLPLMEWETRPVGGGGWSVGGCPSSDRPPSTSQPPPTSQPSSTSCPSSTSWTGMRCVKGGYRRVNEDRCYVDGNRGLLLVVDGMGGQYGGAEASRMMIETLPTAAEVLLDGGAWSGRELRATLRDAVAAVRRRMYLLADVQPEFEQMGCTMAAGVITATRLYFTRVGDCRVYLWRRGELHRLTTDQTYVQMLLDAGAIRPEEVASNPYRHLVLNAIGIKPLDTPLEVESCHVLHGDRVLLCSDGLTEGLTDVAISGLLGDELTPQAAADALVQAALRSGSRDNVTCVVARVAA